MTPWNIISVACRKPSGIRPNCVEEGGGGGVAATTTTTTTTARDGWWMRGWLGNANSNLAQPEVARTREITREKSPGFSMTRDDDRAREPGLLSRHTTDIKLSGAGSLAGRRWTERRCATCAAVRVSVTTARRGARLRERVGGLCPRRDPRRLPSAAEHARAPPNVRRSPLRRLGRYSSTILDSLHCIFTTRVLINSVL